jgi:hypothetical protein
VIPQLVASQVIPALFPRILTLVPLKRIMGESDYIYLGIITPGRRLRRGMFYNLHSLGTNFRFTQPHLNAALLDNFFRCEQPPAIWPRRGQSSTLIYPAGAGKNAGAQEEPHAHNVMSRTYGS